MNPNGSTRPLVWPASDEPLMVTRAQIVADALAAAQQWIRDDTERAEMIARDVGTAAAARFIERREAAAAPKLYRLVSDTEAETLPPPEWGIDGIYPQGGFVLLFGARGTGKTFLTLGWSFAHAQGLEWMGRTAHPGPVVYILAEGSGGLGVRVRAQKESLGIGGPAGVYFITQAVPTLDHAEVFRLISTIKTLPVPPVAIVWDTLSRTLVGGDENSGKDMAQYVANIDRVGEACGAPTRIVVHHSGHGSAERERGSSVLAAAADTVLALREKDGHLELTCEKQKDAAEFSPIPLELKKIDDAGSCVLRFHDEAWNQSGFLSVVERQALQTLHESFLDEGASASAWRAASEMPDSSFYKARTSLVRRNLVEQKGSGNATKYTLDRAGNALRLLHVSTGIPR